MKVLNLMWGYYPGGVQKCYLIYAKLGETDPGLNIRTVCINLLNIPADLSPLYAAGGETIDIRSRTDLSWIGKLKQYIRDFRPDVVFTHAFNGPPLMLVERFCGVKVPVLCSYHGEYHASMGLRRKLEPVLNGFAHWYYKHFASGVLTVCDYCAQCLIREYGVPAEKVHYIHNGILKSAGEIETLQLPEQCKGKIILGTASRLTKIKGISDLLDALVLVQDLPVHLLVIGSGECEKDLQNQAKRLELEKYVTFCGYRENIPSWLELFDIFILPSHHECHSVALLETMRAGLPGIVTDVGGNCESVRDGQEAIVVPSHSPEALAKAIRTMVEHPELRETLGQNARKRFHDCFTLEPMCRKTADWLLSFDSSKK